MWFEQDLNPRSPNHGTYRLAQSVFALTTGPTRLLKKVGLLVQVNRAFNYRTLQKVVYLGIGKHNIERHISGCIMYVL